jgi:hypothetical protein
MPVARRKRPSDTPGPLFSPIHDDVEDRVLDIVIGILVVGKKKREPLLDCSIGTGGAWMGPQEIAA